MKVWKRGLAGPYCARLCDRFFFSFKEEIESFEAFLWILMGVRSFRWV